MLQTHKNCDQMVLDKFIQGNGRASRHIQGQFLFMSNSELTASSGREALSGTKGQILQSMDHSNHNWLMISKATPLGSYLVSTHLKHIK